MKLIFRNIHLYSSLAAGLVIMTCCFSGAILVFENELQQALHHDRYFVKQESLRLPIEQLINNVKQKYLAAKIAPVKIYPDATRSVEIGVSLPQKGNKDKGQEGKIKEVPQSVKATATEGKKDRQKFGLAKENTGAVSLLQDQKRRPKGEGGPGGGRPTHTVFINPYTGNVIELYNYRDTFFYTMFSLHRWLLGSESSVGKTITGVATFIFLFILLTGIILWWPRNKTILKQRLKIKTGASFKRLNHDLHIVLGFYSAIFLFIFAFTALAWSFKWFNNGIYTVTNSSMKPAEPPHSVYQAGKKTIAYDSAFVAISNIVTDVEYYNLRAPNDSTGIFTATVLLKGAHETAADNYYVDQYSGHIIGASKYKDKNLGQRVTATFKPVHVGSIYGWPSKIIAFLACALGVTFPITGTIMWINRLRKKKKLQQGNRKLQSLTTVAEYEDEDYN